MYANDKDFRGIFEKSSQHGHGLFHLEGGFLFKRLWLYIVKSGFRVLLIQELYGGALVSHFGIEKTCSMIKEHYYAPKISGDVEHLVKPCSTCQFAKSHVLHQGLCSPLPIRLAPWEDVSLDLITSLSRT